jgi:molybdopterin synthase sulfurtransferase
VLTTEEVRELAGRGDVHLVDCRPIDAYNGWRLRGEDRGGHIPGARSAAGQVGRVPGLDRDRALQGDRARVGPSSYTATTEERPTPWRPSSAPPATTTSAPTTPSSTEWAADAGPPHGPPAPAPAPGAGGWVHRLITGEGETREGDPPSRRGRGPGRRPSYDVRRATPTTGTPEDYDEGPHPRRGRLDTLLLESPETWNRRSPEEVRDALLGLGITADTTVVLYGRFSFPDNDDPFPGSSAGQLAAFRCAFIMLWAGVKNVRVLNGGMQSWLDGGYQTSTEPVTPTPAGDDFGVEVPGGPGARGGRPRGAEILASPGANLVSVRSWPEYIGEVSGYNYIEKKGRIPGSVFGNCGSDAYHMENYRNLDHTTREYGEIMEEWRGPGSRRTSGTPSTAAPAGAGARRSSTRGSWAGPGSPCYDGGWFEWSSDDANPIETGEPGGPPRDHPDSVRDGVRGEEGGGPASMAAVQEAIVAEMAGLEDALKKYEYLVGLGRALDVPTTRSASPPTPSPAASRGSGSGRARGRPAPPRGRQRRHDHPGHHRAAAPGPRRPDPRRDPRRRPRLPRPHGPRRPPLPLPRQRPGRPWCGRSGDTPRRPRPSRRRAGSDERRARPRAAWPVVVRDRSL